NRWFLLGDVEFGSVLENLPKRLLRRGSVARMIEEAFGDRVDTHNLPPVRIRDGDVDLSEVPAGQNRAEIARAIMEYYALRFGGLLEDLTQTLGTPKRIFVGGGLSRNSSWLDLLERRNNITFQVCTTEHPGLLGV